MFFITNALIIFLITQQNTTIVVYAYWHRTHKNIRRNAMINCVDYQVVESQLLSFQSFRDLSAYTERQTDGHGWNNSAIDADEAYTVYFIGSETLASTCYIHPEEYNVFFNSTSNGYKYVNML